MSRSGFGGPEDEAAAVVFLGLHACDLMAGCDDQTAGTVTELLIVVPRQQECFVAALPIALALERDFSLAVLEVLAAASGERFVSTETDEREP